MPEFRRTRALAVGLILSLFVAAFSVDYTVEKGDTLGRIARDHDVSLSDLVEANNIANPNLIYPGQVLLIPGQEGDSLQVHIVSRGETLNKIASTYGVDTATIVAANGIANPNLIYPGQELVIAGTPSTTSSGASSQSGTTDSSATEVNGVTSVRSGKSHIVKRGETVASVAAQHKGVTAEDIIDANGIVNGVIYTGTRLFLDGPGYVAEGTEGTTDYTVQKGDRLADIAARTGVSLTQIASTNNIANVNLIRSGQILTLPSGNQWVCPVEASNFFNDWGFPRGGGSRYHEGNDLFAAFRAPVRAPVAGTVMFKVGSIGGNQFNLTGDDGVLYIGSHMDEVVGSSRRVSAGEVLGYVGTSGNAAGTRPHLHLGMYWNGIVVNPYPSLVANGCK